MRKLKKGRKLSRKRDQRKSLLKSLAREFFLKGKIKTTEAKAKEAVPFIEKQISRAKIANLASQRLLLRIFSREVVKKLIKEIGPKYKERKGGYTRIVKLGKRRSDGAEMAIIEFAE